jgi:hypothetical protein
MWRLAIGVGPVHKHEVNQVAFHHDRPDELGACPPGRIGGMDELTPEILAEFRALTAR